MAGGPKQTKSSVSRDRPTWLGTEQNGSYTIKKWAALAALGAAAFYLLLSGAEVATQRSFIMVAIVLIGIMVDRPTLTFRTLTVAALVVLLLAPEAIVHPSFQMSFAATLALVAGYQHGLPWMSGGGKTRLAAKIALWGGREIAGLLLVSLLAGAATIPYIAYHFHRISPYGVIAKSYPKVRIADRSPVICQSYVIRIWV